MEYKIKRYCPRCGKVHEGTCSADLPKLNAHQKRDSEADRFRNTQVWKRTAKLILERDFHCCRVCLSHGILRSRGLSVHHIFSLRERFDLRLCEWNLVTLCRHCHELAERGIIPRKVLLGLSGSKPELTSMCCKYPPTV